MTRIPYSINNNNLIIILINTMLIALDFLFIEYKTIPLFEICIHSHKAAQSKMVNLSFKKAMVRLNGMVLKHILKNIRK